MSIPFTLKKAYLKTLSAGKHEVEMVWKNGSAKTTLTLEEAPAEEGNPETGDSSNMILWFLAFGGAAAALIVTGLKKRTGR